MRAPSSAQPESVGEAQSEMEQIMATLAATKETVSPRIPNQEFAERVSKIQAKMRSQQIDLLVAYSNALDPGHVRYFSDVVGINEAAAIVIPSRGDAIVCAGQASQAWAAHKSRLADVRIVPEVGEVAAPEYIVGETHSFADLFRDLAGTISVKKIGIVGRLIFPQVIYAKLKDCFPEAEIIDAEPLVFELACLKEQQRNSVCPEGGRDCMRLFSGSSRTNQTGMDRTRHYGRIHRWNLQGAVQKIPRLHGRR